MTLRIRKSRIRVRHVRLGTVQITYLPNQQGDHYSLPGVAYDDYVRLSTVVEAYRGLADLHGQRQAHPNEHVRSATREVLGLPQPKPQTPPRQLFPIVARTFHRQRGRFTVTDQTTLSLQPWLFARVEFTDTAAIAVRMPPQQ